MERLSHAQWQHNMALNLKAQDILCHFAEEGTWFEVAFGALRGVRAIRTPSPSARAFDIRTDAPRGASG
jgi:hypothetical protein